MFKPRRMTWARHETGMRTKKNACKILVVKSEGKRSLGRLKHRWEDNSGWGCVDWI
jgi:hypothetical protein